ncbi:Abhydrolase domain-containing protein [Ceratobasidium sp. AG-Ba]|nr:Abhydrolase domain-containing protein [Ceratobasidium sp. AG-Ba]
MYPFCATAFGIVVAAVVSASPFSLPPGYHQFSPRAENITWGPCPNATNAAQCGRFKVPLDYQNATAGKASLAVVKYPATKKPKIGTLFWNGGGPGGSGVVDLTSSLAQILSDTTGGQYDIFSWDPRGVGLTQPNAACFATATEEALFWGDTVPYAGIEARGNFTDQADIDAFYAQVPQVDEKLVQLGQKCQEYSPNTFRYIGTAAVARDIVMMHDYLEGPDKPINFWGISYGSVLGIYLANMFPDRVGRVVIDGVLDPEYWAQRPSYELWGVSIQSADDAFTGFVTACASAGPGNCALASNGSTPDSVRQDVWNAIDIAYNYRKSHGLNLVLSSALVRFDLLKKMYFPTKWPELAETLAKITKTSNNNTSSVGSISKAKRATEWDTTLLPRAPVFRRQNSSNSDPASSYAFQGITCADSVDAGNVTTKMVFDDILRVTREVSPMFGPSQWFSFHNCHRWPVRAVERYTGPFNKSLSNPILVVGNKADPITPFASAKKVADAWGSSAILVEQDNYGHTSIAMVSDCTTALLRNYFLNGTIPSSDQFCGTNQALFPGSGVPNAAQQATRTFSSSLAVLLLFLIHALLGSL